MTKKDESKIWRIKTYKVKVKVLDISTGKNRIVLNKREAQSHGIHAGYRAVVKQGKEEIVAVVEVAGDDVIPRGYVGVYKDFATRTGIGEGNVVEILNMPRPDSLTYIRKKMDNKVHEPHEIDAIITDMMENKLNESELGAWVSAVYINGLNENETVALTEAIAHSGEMLDLGKPIVADKHCIGGVPGNRTTMILVPIVAANNIYIPKTSSRAITSPAGTADTMEVLANVNLNIDELREVVMKSHGAMVWGGNLNLAPADDRLIEIRNPLHLDPKGMLLASIMAKKRCVHANHVLIDIPMGPSAKIEKYKDAEELAQDFINIGRGLGMHVEVIITDGSQPIGHGAGPILEARDVLSVLEGNGPRDLMEKGTMMAGKILEMCGKAKPGEGQALAKKTLESGKALAKMREIIGLQGGNENVKIDDLVPGQYTYDVEATKEGRILYIDNKAISQLARIAGSPLDKGAGIYLWKSKGDMVRKGDKLFTIYAESEAKLEFAIKALEHLDAIKLEKMLLGVVKPE